MSTTSTIIYTLTDEAPALATRSLLPIVQAFSSVAGIALETRDISLAGRIVALFPEVLTPQQQQPDDLAYLGDLATTLEANIIKLPNISASTPQLKAAIKELQSQGYALPDFPDEPKTAAEKDARARYDKVKGSAVNPVLREGNSDRRAPSSVKNYARKHPHKMAAWSAGSKAHVAHMDGGDFFGSEKSVLIERPGNLKIEFTAADGAKTVLKEKTPVLAGEVVDAAVMSKKALDAFLEAQVADAKANDVRLLRAAQSHDDEGLGSDHLRRGRLGLLFRRLREARRNIEAARRRPECWASAISSRASRRCRKKSKPRSKPTSRRNTPSVRSWRWSTRTKASRACTSRATSSSTHRCRR